MRYVLFVCARETQLWVCRWRRSPLCLGVFSGPDQQQALGMALARLPARPAAILADLVEEEFRFEKAPSVPWHYRRQWLRRCLQRQFSGHACRRGRWLPRRHDGRDVSLRALVDDGRLDQLMTLLEGRGMAVVAVHSVPDLLEQLWRPGPQAQLLVTELPASGARINMFLGGCVLLSRLITPADQRRGSLPAELAGTRDYIGHLGLPGELSKQVSCIVDGERHLRRVDLDGNAANCEPAPNPLPHLHQALLSVAGSTRGRGYLQRRSPQARLRMLIRPARSLMVLVTVLLSGLSAAALTGAWLNQRTVTELRQRLSALEQVIATQRQQLPATQVTPSRMRDLVDRIDRLHTAPRRVQALLQSLAAAMAAVPELSVDELDWHTTSERSTGDDPVAPGTLSLRLSGRVRLAEIDDQREQALVRRLIDRLQADQGLQQVRLSADRGRQAELSGRLAPLPQPATAAFTIEAVWHD